MGNDRDCGRWAEPQAANNKGVLKVWKKFVGKAQVTGRSGSRELTLDKG